MVLIVDAGKLEVKNELTYKCYYCQDKRILRYEYEGGCIIKPCPRCNPDGSAMD